ERECARGRERAFWCLQLRTAKPKHAGISPECPIEVGCADGFDNECQFYPPAGKGIQIDRKCLPADFLPLLLEQTLAIDFHRKANPVDHDARFVEINSVRERQIEGQRQTIA